MELVDKRQLPSYKQFRPISNAILILTDYVVNDAVNIVPGEHLPSEGKLDCEETFWLKLYTLPPEFHLWVHRSVEDEITAIFAPFCVES